MHVYQEKFFVNFCHLASLVKILSTNHFLFYTHRSQGVATYYCITPTFRGTKFSWISWFDFWSRKFSSQKFSIIVGVATFQAHWKRDRAYTCTHTSERMNCLKQSIESLLTMYRLCELTFKKWAKVAYQIRKDLCPNNFLRLVSNSPTTTLKRWPNTR